MPPKAVHGHQEKQLRAGKSIWLAFPSPKISSRPAIDGLSADVLIIAAGISGALISEMAAFAGLSVLIVDRRGPILWIDAGVNGAGSVRNRHTANKLREKIGEKNAIRAWRRSKLAVENLAHRTEHLGIKCQMFRRNSLISMQKSSQRKVSHEMPPVLKRQSFPDQN